MPYHEWQHEFTSDAAKQAFENSGAAMAEQKEEQQAGLAALLERKTRIWHNHIRSAEALRRVEADHEQLTRLSPLETGFPSDEGFPVTREEEEDHRRQLFEAIVDFSDVRSAHDFMMNRVEQLSDIEAEILAWKFLVSTQLHTTTDYDERDWS